MTESCTNVMYSYVNMMISVKIYSGRRIIVYASRGGKGTRSTFLFLFKLYIESFDPINYCYENKEIEAKRHSNG